MTSLLLVEDEPRVSSFIERGLKAEGYDVTVAGSGREGLARGLDGAHDVLILDVMLPDISGTEVCERLRSRGVAAPILFLTARDSDEDVVDGLGRGADDYLAKPFSFDVLIARLEALMRRAATPPRAAGAAETATLGPLTMDLRARDVRVGGELLDLTRREFDVLWTLANRPDRVHSRERILAAAWGANADPLTNVVDVYVARLRKKLAASAGAPEIATLRGVGYRLRLPS